MTLLDAPVFDEARSRRRYRILLSASIGVFVLFIGWWVVAGMPVDMPWNWNTHLRGRMAVNHFLEAVEKNDLPKAYGIWLNNPDWQKNPPQNTAYTFDRFQEDWSPTSHDNEYGAIQSHKIVAARIYGNVLVVGSLINGRKSKALFLAFDSKEHTVGFSPVELQLGQ